jgi:hypothetical protein
MISNISRRSNAQSNQQNMFQSHRRNEQILQKTEKCWKETTQKRLDSEKVQHNRFLGDSINQLAVLISWFICWWNLMSILYHYIWSWCMIWLLECFVDVSLRNILRYFQGLHHIDKMGQIRFQLEINQNSKKKLNFLAE